MTAPVNHAAEEWRPIYGLAQAYEVSNLGRVRNASGLVMKLKLTEAFPYPTVALRKAQGGRIHKAVHRLVGEAFLGPRPDGMVTRHLNGNTADNRAFANLIYGTQEENCADTVAQGRTPHGEGHCCARLTEASARLALTLWSAGISKADLGRLFKVHPRTIGDLVNGKTWKHLREPQCSPPSAS